jgi:hypothetical protein
MLTTEITDFFDRYRDAFNRLDGDAVADLWHVPSGIAGTQQGRPHLTWWSDGADMRHNHRALCDVYRRAGYARADHHLAHVESMGDDHAFARVQWTLSRLDGSLLQAFATGYQLMRTAQGPRVLLCTAYEENLKEMTPRVAQ